MSECSFIQNQTPKQQRLIVPSQVLLRKYKTTRLPSNAPGVGFKQPIPSPDVVGVGVILSADSNKDWENVIASPSTSPPRLSVSSQVKSKSSHSRRRRRRPRIKQPLKHKPSSNQTQLIEVKTATETGNSHSVGSHGDSRKTRQQTGRIPNIYWGAIPMDHLRQHPRFIPLPLPSQISQLDCLEDVRNFRQDSWQWDALHSGRCTTSQLASALGFLNPKTGDILGIPRSMRSQTAGVHAYHRLMQKPLRTLDEMNDVLCNASYQKCTSKISTTGQEGIWVIPSKPRNSWHFSAYYMENATISTEKRQRLERLVETGVINGANVRMMWGNTQEATAILSALNYLTRKEPGLLVKEVGMCGAGLHCNATKTCESHDLGLLIGASPDALLVYPDGRVEVLEVKNHCPFVLAAPPKMRNVKSNRGMFAIRSMPFHDARSRIVPPQYLPQLMMEMLCVGPKCASAVLVRQTATDGAMILRVHRNEDWIKEMLFWLTHFHNSFVQQNMPPSINFFWNDDSPEHGKERYMKFLLWTQDLCSGVEVVDYIPNNLVQRATTTGRSMFLDHIVDKV